MTKHVSVRLPSADAAVTALSSLRDRAGKPSRPYGLQSHGAEGPLARHERKLAAIAAVRARFHAEWLKLSADMEAEIRAIEREFA